MPITQSNWTKTVSQNLRALVSNSCWKHKGPTIKCNSIVLRMRDPYSLIVCSAAVPRKIRCGWGSANRWAIAMTKLRQYFRFWTLILAISWAPSLTLTDTITEAEAVVQISRLHGRIERNEKLPDRPVVVVRLNLE